MSLGKKKKRSGFRSPAACLLPQFEENMRRGGRGRRGAEYAGDESPGKLFTYVSAGNIELPGETDAKPVFVRSRRPVVLMAVLLVLIWVLF